MAVFRRLAALVSSGDADMRDPQRLAQSRSARHARPEYRLTLRQADQAREDFSAILDELDFLKM